MTRKFLHKYVLPRKDYQIKALTENRQDFVVEESYWFLNINWWYFYIGEDSKIGTPFTTYERAKTAQEKLEKKETKEVVNREIIFIWTSVLIILAAITCKIVL